VTWIDTEIGEIPFCIGIVLAANQNPAISFQPTKISNFLDVQLASQSL
jgi:hypothetical protein